MEVKASKQPDRKSTFRLMTMEDWSKCFDRILINGPPYSGKTTSFMTWPAPRQVIIAPGELGNSSILPDDDTKIHLCTFDPNSPSTDWVAIMADVIRLSKEILRGDHGPVTTFAIDGLHHLYYVFMMGKGYYPGIDTTEYSKYHEVFDNFLKIIIGSNVPKFVASCYDGTEPIEPGSKSTQIFPDLPGKMAKRILGTFPVTLHATRKPVEGGGAAFEWRVHPFGKIQGVGAHIPKEISEKLPAVMDQDWKALDATITRLLEEQRGVKRNEEPKELVDLPGGIFK